MNEQKRDREEECSIYTGWLCVQFVSRNGHKKGGEIDSWASDASQPSRLNGRFFSIYSIYVTDVLLSLHINNMSATVEEQLLSLPS